MLLDEAERLAHKLMDEYHLLEKGWTFKWDGAQRRFGQCAHHRKTISLSRHLVARNGAEQVEDTIRHEIAHALVGGGHGHDHVWRAMCVTVGADPTTCYGDEVDDTPHRWEGRCTNPYCGMVYKRIRLKRQAKYATCGRCRNQELLRWVEVRTDASKQVVEFVDDLPGCPA